jgi:hypothetical protein
MVYFEIENNNSLYSFKSLENSREFCDRLRYATIYKEYNRRYCFRIMAFSRRANIWEIKVVRWLGKKIIGRIK